MTGSTPLYDLPNGRIIRPEDGQPLVVPAGAVVVPGARAVTVGEGAGLGPVARDAGHREVPRRPHRHAHGARTMDPLSLVAACADARRHRLDDGAGSRLRPLARRLPARPWLHRGGAAGLRRSVQRRCHDRPAPGRALDALRLRAAVLSQPRSRRSAARPRGVRRRRASWRRRSARSSGCGPRVSGRSARCSSWARNAGSDGARVANGSPNACRFLVNGEPTESRLAAATRGALRLKLTAHGRAGHSSYPETGESAIEKLLDALVRLRSIELPRARAARPHPLHRRAHQRRRSRRT